MKTRNLLLAGLVIGFTSCSTAYRVGQTPDDVYFSPAPPQEEYVTTTNQQDRDAYGYNDGGRSEDYAIRRGINDPVYRNSSSLDFGYGYDPYNSYGSSYYSPYSYGNPYLYSGITFYPYNYNYYDPYYSSYNYYYAPLYYNLKPGNSVSNYNAPRRYNLGVYNRKTGTTSNYTIPANPNTGSVPVRTFAPPPPSNTSGFAGFVRRIFTPNNTTDRSPNTSNGRDNNYNNTPARSFQSSTPSSGSSSSGGGGGGSAPVRTFRR